MVVFLCYWSYIFCICGGENVSYAAALTCGVPQGPILGPILLSLYMLELYMIKHPRIQLRCCLPTPLQDLRDPLRRYYWICFLYLRLSIFISLKLKNERALRHECLAQIYCKNERLDVVQTLDMWKSHSAIPSYAHKITLTHTHRFSLNTYTQPTFGKILELVTGLLLPPLPGLEQFPYWRQLASWLPRRRGILGIGGAVHHHVTAGQRWRFLHPINWKRHRCTKTY